MRITGGELRGRILAVPKSGAIRPTQDRVREALFSMLAPELPNADVLDLFAGTGAVGLEAVSRGARRATFVETDRRHVTTIKANIESLGATDKASVIVADAYRWIASYFGPGFSMAFADPPYALGEERGYAFVLETLARRGVVREGGLFVAEMTAVQTAEETPGWELLRDRTYGKTRICVWRALKRGCDIESHIAT